MAGTIGLAKTGLDYVNQIKDQGLIDATKDMAKKKFLSLVLLWATPGVVIGAIVFGVIIIGMAVLISWAASFNDSPTALAGTPSQLALHEIGDDLPLFQQAQDKYGVSWAILAAISNIESSLGQYPNGSVSPCGAVGYMQFLPQTWSGWSNPNAKDDVNWRPTAMPPSPSSQGLPYDTNPDRIAQYGGYGVDADQDGYADPYDHKDAIFSAAAYLKANHDPGQNWEDAIYAYNHDMGYVHSVEEIAEKYQMYQIPGCTGMWPTPSGFEVTTYFKQTTSSSGAVLWPEGHQGIDIGCPEGTVLYASIPGEIEFAGYDPQVYGNEVRIRNNEQQTVLIYGHLSQIYVIQGQQVMAGQVLGLSGQTGRAYGAHLHFEVRVGGQLCDPLGWLVPPSTNPTQTTKNY